MEVPSAKPVVLNDSSSTYNNVPGGDSDSCSNTADKGTSVAYVFSDSYLNHCDKMPKAPNRVSTGSCGKDFAFKNQKG